MPFIALWGTKYLADRAARSRSSSPTAAAGHAARGVASSIRVSSTRAPAPRATTIRTPTSASAQAFLNQIYEAVTDRPGWAKTVLVITYDEWGGFFDHVAAGAPRRDATPEAGTALRGFRVPAS